MKLYHGSKNIISHPIAYGSDEHNDYGPAFYLTKDLESAHIWACRNNTIGYVNTYELDEKGLKVLNLLDNSICIANATMTCKPIIAKSFIGRKARGNVHKAIAPARRNAGKRSFNCSVLL